MEIEFLPNRLGVQIKGQLTDFTPEEIAEIPDMVARSQIVVMEQQEIEPKRFNEVNLAWGKHNPVDIWCNHEEFPIIFRVTNREVKEGKQGLFSQGELDWHCNGVFSSDPEEVVCLYCIQPDGSNTYFTNSVRAFEDLPEDYKWMLEDATITVTNNVKRTYLGQQTYSTQLEDEQKALNEIGGRTRDGIKDEHGRLKKVEKKLFQNHPITGAPMIYFPYLSVSSINHVKGQMTPRTLFDGLVSHYVESNRYTYVQEWKPGDLILADQLAGIHKRDPIVGDRELWRTAFWYNR